MRKQAFTLIELLVIMAIIGILATVVMFSISNARVKALNSKRASDLDTLYKAVKLYYTGEKNVVLDKYECKVGEAGCLDELVAKGYMKSLPLGPNGKCNTSITPDDPGGECYFYTFDTGTEIGNYEILYTTMLPPQAGPFRLGKCAPGFDFESRYCLGFKVN